jgi:hypothetical protein
MAKETSNTLAVRSSTDLAGLAEFDAIILGQREAPPVDIVEDPAEISREIMMQLLAAESDEELQNFGNAQGWRELEGTPILLKNFKWRPSSYDEGGPIYVVVQGTRLDTGEQVILTTGSGNVLAQLSNLARRGKLGEKDCVWKLERAAKETQRGYRPLHLEKVDVPVSDAA